MPSPFPGMDPYLEGHLWPDVHQTVAGEISRRLSRALRPKYVTRLAVATVEDDSSTPEIDSQDRQVTVEVYDLEHNQLVTSIEILSPVNKRPPGLDKFVAKRERLSNAGVNLLTIDLIRRGQRALPSTPSTESKRLAQADYLVTLLRGMDYRMQAWPIRLQELLPVVAVPLRPPDADVPLDLNGILAAIYDEAGYDLTIDYSTPPPAPSLDEESAMWLEQQLSAIRAQ